jgi:hypothetical protein
MYCISSILHLPAPKMSKLELEPEMHPVIAKVVMYAVKTHGWPKEFGSASVLNAWRVIERERERDRERDRDRDRERDRDASCNIRHLALCALRSEQRPGYLTATPNGVVG